MSNVTTAMVLAAGLGTRMRPLTDVIPKPLVRLRGRPLIDHVLDRLAANGITRAVVNLHHHADKLEAHLRGRRAPRIVLSDERDALLDTGGGVARALPLLGQRPFLVHNSDSVWAEGVGSNLARLLAAWNPERMDCLMLLALASATLGYDGPGDFTMAPDGRLTRRGERQVAPFAFAGVSIMTPALLQGLPQGRFSLNRAWDIAVERERLYGIRLEGTWMHIGTPDALVAAEGWLDREQTR